MLVVILTPTWRPQRSCNDAGWRLQCCFNMVRYGCNMSARSCRMVAKSRKMAARWLREGGNMTERSGKIAARWSQQNRRKNVKYYKIATKIVFCNSNAGANLAPRWLQDDTHIRQKNPKDDTKRERWHTNPDRCTHKSGKLNTQIWRKIPKVAEFVVLHDPAV